MNLLRELVEHALQVVRQRAREFHAPLLGGMRDDQPRGMKERTREVRDRAKIARHTAMDAAVQRIADDGMANRAEVDANLVRASGVNRDVRQRQDDAELLGLHDSRYRLPAPPCFGRHLLAVDWIAADRRVDAAS